MQQATCRVSNRSPGIAVLVKHRETSVLRVVPCWSRRFLGEGCPGWSVGDSLVLSRRGRKSHGGARKKAQLVPKAQVKTVDLGGMSALARKSAEDEVSLLPGPQPFLQNVWSWALNFAARIPEAPAVSSTHHRLL